MKFLFVTITKVVAGLCLLGLLAQWTAVEAVGQDDSFRQIRFRVISVDPDDSTTEIANTGTTVAVGSAVVPEFDFSYFFKRNWAVEAIAAVTPHDLEGAGGALDGVDAGEVLLLPPTITLQYHFPSGSFDPYIGAGVNFTSFIDYDLSDDLAGAGVSDIDFDESFGLALQAGFDVIFAGNWTFNLDVKYIQIATDATIQLAGGGELDTIEVDINPFVSGIGVGYRF
jgi:outer membrane protein